VAQLTGAQARSTAHPAAQTVGRVEETVALVEQWQTALATPAVLAGRQIMDTPQRGHLLCTLAAAVAAQVDIAVLVVLEETINQRELLRREQTERLALVERLVAVAEGRD